MRTQITQIENSKLQAPNSKFQETRDKENGRTMIGYQGIRR